MKEERSEMFLQSGLIINSEVINQTFVTRTFRRDTVSVKNALGSHYKKGSVDSYPNFTENQKKLFVKRGLIPLSEIRYWLGWSNCTRQDPNEHPFNLSDYLEPGVDIDSLSEDEKSIVTGLAFARNIEESPFDFPTGKAILGFLDVTLREYSDLAGKLQVRINSKISRRFRQISAVPINDYLMFLAQFRSHDDDSYEPDRTELIQALDEFVGQYL